MDIKFPSECRAKLAYKELILHRTTPNALPRPNITSSFQLLYSITNVTMLFLSAEVTNGDQLRTKWRDHQWPSHRCIIKVIFYIQKDQQIERNRVYTPNPSR